MLGDRAYAVWFRFCIFSRASCSHPGVTGDRTLDPRAKPFDLNFRSVSKWMSKLSQVTGVTAYFMCRNDTAYFIVL